MTAVKSKKFQLILRIPFLSGAKSNKGRCKSRLGRAIRLQEACY